MNDCNQIEELLTQFVSKELHGSIPDLVRILSYIIDSKAQDSPPKKPKDSVQVAQALRELIGHPFHVHDSVITFQEDTKTGDIKIGDVAKGNILKVSVDGTIGAINRSETKQDFRATTQTGGAIFQVGWVEFKIPHITIFLIASLLIAGYLINSIRNGTLQLGQALTINNLQLRGSPFFEDIPAKIRGFHGEETNYMYELSAALEEVEVVCCSDPELTIEVTSNRDGLKIASFLVVKIEKIVPLTQTLDLVRSMPEALPSPDYFFVSEFSASITSQSDSIIVAPLITREYQSLLPFHENPIESNEHQNLIIDRLGFFILDRGDKEVFFLNINTEPGFVYTMRVGVVFHDGSSQYTRWHNDTFTVVSPRFVRGWINLGELMQFEGQYELTEILFYREMAARNERIAANNPYFALPGRESQAEVQPLPTVEISDLPVCWKATSNGEVTIRSSPTKDSDVITRLSGYVELWVLCQSIRKESDDYTIENWVKVGYFSDRRKLVLGWIFFGENFMYLHDVEGVDFEVVPPDTTLAKAMVVIPTPASYSEEPGMEYYPYPYPYPSPSTTFVVPYPYPVEPGMEYYPYPRPSTTMVAPYP